MEKMEAFFALVTPIDKGIVPPTPGQPGIPTHPISGVGTPEHPIVLPPGSAGPGLPEAPIWFPADPGYGIDTGHRPTHPIVFPPGLPVSPEHPIAYPPTPGLPPLVPTHPIVLPGWDVHPDHELPTPPEGTQPGPKGKVDAVVTMLPPNKMAVPPGIPPDSQAAILWYGPGTLPVQVWVPPPAEHKNPNKRGSKVEQDERAAEARYKAGGKEGGKEGSKE